MSEQSYEQQVQDLNTLSDEEFLRQVDKVITNAENEKEVQQEVEKEQLTTEIQEVEREKATTQEVPEKEPQEPTSEEPEQAETKEEDTDTTKQEKEAEIDFSEVFNKPIRTNGKDIYIKTPEEAVKLIQMGAGFAKKMEAVKKQLPFVKALKDNGIDNPEQVQFLIELSQKKPEAIAKLIKESGVDLYDFDLEQADNYKPSVQIENEQTMAIMEVLNNIEGRSTYQQTINFIQQDLDEESKNIIAQNPEVIDALSQQMEDGVFNTVMGEVTKQKMLGNLNNVPVLQAYYQVGQQLFGSTQPQANTVLTQQQQQTSTDSNTLDTQRNQRRQKVAAGSKTNTSKKSSSISLDELVKMSDEEFEKLNI